ncbi:hypothetical protein [Gynuella sunshinyii]|uniref:hypothetical protein n=1 Tax=Gynuella sunshinyii TaxID=1445505 RepID=UPI003CCC4632
MSYHQFIYWRQKLQPKMDGSYPTHTQQLLPVHYSSEGHSRTPPHAHLTQWYSHPRHLQ